METTDRPVWECGVSLKFLLDFVHSIAHEPKWRTAQDITTNHIIPKTQDKRCRYVDLLPEEHVSKPTYFVSHVWGASFRNLVAGIQNYLEMEENAPETENVFFWVDIFAVNQHRGENQQSDLQSLHIAIEKASKTLVCIDENAVLLTRIWCLFEILQTFHFQQNTEGEKMIVITQDTDFEKLKDIFVKCDVRKAQATVEDDRVRILATIGETIGFEKMNENIKKALVSSAKYETENISEDLLKNNPKKAASIFYKYAEMLHFTADFENSLFFHQKSFDLRVDCLGENHPQTAQSLNKLGAIHFAIGNYQKAEELLFKSLQVCEQVLGKDHKITSVTLLSLGALLKKLGKYDQAEEMYRSSLKIREEKYGPENTLTSVPLNKLALLLKERGKSAEAEILFKRCVAIREKEFGMFHPETATALNNLGDLLRQLSRFKEAEPLCRKALEIRETILGVEHPSTTLSENALGRILLALKKFDEAQIFFQRSLETRQKILGEEHPDTASSINNLATVFRKTNQFAKAEPLLKRALHIREKVFGAEHKDTSTSLNALALFFLDIGKLEEAEPLFRRALAIREKVFGASHRDTKQVANNLVLLMKKKT